MPLTKMRQAFPTFIRRMPKKIQLKIQAIIAQGKITEVLGQVWSQLSPAEQERFGSAATFRRFLQSYKKAKFYGNVSPATPSRQTPLQAVLNAEGKVVGRVAETTQGVGKERDPQAVMRETFYKRKDRTAHEREIAIFNRWIQPISSAVKKTMFIPVVQYKGSGGVAGLSQIEYWKTAGKIYTFYWPYDVWRKGVEAIGPPGIPGVRGGHGMWSVILSLTWMHRVGVTGRGWMKASEILNAYRALSDAYQDAIAGETTGNSAWMRYGAIPNMPPLKSRRALPKTPREKRFSQKSVTVSPQPKGKAGEIVAQTNPQATKSVDEEGVKYKWKPQPVNSLTKLQKTVERGKFFKKEKILKSAKRKVIKATGIPKLPKLPKRKKKK